MEMFLTSNFVILIPVPRKCLNYLLSHCKLLNMHLIYVCAEKQFKIVDFKCVKSMLDNCITVLPNEALGNAIVL